MGGRGGGVEEKKKAAKGEEAGSERERGEQAHLYVWLPSAKRSATPGLINSEKRSQSFFFASHRHTWLGNDFHII